MTDLLEETRRPHLTRSQSSKVKFKQWARLSRPGSIGHAHSYDTHFSTTALHNLVNSTPGSRDEGSHPRKDLNFTELASQVFLATTELGHERSESYPNANSHLLMRTGSRLWEETRESKGQSWLGTRASSTRLYSSDSDNDSEKDIDRRIRVRQAKFMVGVEDETDEDEYHFDDEDEQIINSNDIISRSKILSFVDWVLGIGEEGRGLSQTFDQSTRPLTREEKIRIREENAKEGRLDVAWILAMLAGSTWSTQT